MWCHRMTVYYTIPYLSVFPGLSCWCEMVAFSNVVVFFAYLRCVAVVAPYCCRSCYTSFCRFLIFRFVTRVGFLRRPPVSFNSAGLANTAWYVVQLRRAYFCYISMPSRLLHYQHQTTTLHTANSSINLLLPVYTVGWLHVIALVNMPSRFLFVMTCRLHLNVDSVLMGPVRGVLQ